MAIVLFARGSTARRSAVGGGLGGVGVIGDVDPVADFVGGGVDDGDARSVLIVGEDVSALGEMEMRWTCFATGMVAMSLRLAMSTTLTVPAWTLEV